MCLVTSLLIHLDQSHRYYLLHYFHPFLASLYLLHSHNHNHHDHHQDDLLYFLSMFWCCEAESNNGVIKEWVRACYHHLPYVNLSRTMTKYLVLACTKKLNYFTSQHVVSKYYSPLMILHQQNIKFDKNCKYVLERILKHMMSQVIETLQHLMFEWPICSERAIYLSFAF